MRNCSLCVSIGLLCFSLTTMTSAGADQPKPKPKSTPKPVVRVEKKAIKPSVTYQFNGNVRTGRVVKAKAGEPGTVKRTYAIVEKNGKKVRELVKEERSLPENTVYYMGRGGYPTSRGSWTRTRVLDMIATAYTASPSENGGSTRSATGNSLIFGVVAVDPRVIPLGTKLYVEGYGFAYACDTGGAIKGNRIDLLMPSRSASNQWGRRHVKVHVLSVRD